MKRMQREDALELLLISHARELHLVVHDGGGGMAGVLLHGGRVGRHACAGAARACKGRRGIRMRGRTRASRYRGRRRGAGSVIYKFAEEGSEVGRAR